MTTLTKIFLLSILFFVVQVVLDEANIIQVYDGIWRLIGQITLITILGSLVLIIITA